MATQTRRPDSTILNTWTINPSGTAHGVLSDDSDETTVFSTSDGTLCGVGLAASSIPGGSLVKSGAIRVRCSKFGSASASGVLRIGASQPSASADVVVSWATPTTITTLLLTKAETDAMIGGSGRAVTHLHVSGGGLVAYETYWDIIYVPKPEVSVTAPTGTLTTDNHPTVEWTNTLDSDGGPQTHFRVQIKTDPGGTVVEDSGVVVASATSWQVPEALDDDDYTAEVEVAQTVNGEQHWSDSDSEAFTVDALKPPLPGVTRAAEHINARIKIDIAEGSGDEDADYWEVEVSNDAENWRPLRTPDGPGLVPNPDPGGPGSATAYDWEGSNGVERFIRVRAIKDHGGGATIASAWVSGSATWSDNAVWIKHPTRPDLNVRAG